MNAAEAKKLVILSAAGTATFSAIKAARSGNVPARRMVVGSLVVAIALSAVAEFQPDAAGAFAALMLVTAVFVLGGDAAAGITKITKPAPITGVTGP